jgi:hypothetical protein
MTPREVGGLQALAKAHGGSLTINPHTGLAEAGFLRNLLPALAGAGLMMIPGMQALGAAAIVGGGTALATGDLKSGLMAGLGAYGGAGLADGALTGAATEGGTGSAIPSAPDVSAAPATPVETIQAGGQAGPATQPIVGPNAQPQMIGADIEQMPLQQQRMIGADFEQMPANMPAQNTVTNPIQQPPAASGFQRAGQNFMADPKLGIAAISPALNMERKPLPEEEEYNGPLSQYRFDPNKYRSADRSQPNPYYQARMYNYAGGGPIEQMSNANSVGQNTGYPMADLHQGAYATPWQTPISQNVVQGSADVGVNPMTGEQNSFAGGGGISSLGGYSDGGRMLKGPGDGMSDSIPAKIGSNQPARLADGEFVVPADVVSHLGNGSTDAGARQLYSMMDRIRSQRTGKKSQAPKVNPKKAMPA